MSVPDSPAAPADRLAPPGAAAAWAALTPQAKRERILQAAIAVFAERGLEAPMHEVAAAAGAGVASLYRIFPSKHELWAEIVVRRMDEITAAFAAAADGPGDRWTALVDLIGVRVAHQSPEPFVTEARAVVEGQPEVVAAIARAADAQERLLAAARAEGRLRADATVEDIRLLFAATRAARHLQPDRVGRMLELMIDALDARRGDG